MALLAKGWKEIFYRKVVVDKTIPSQEVPARMPNFLGLGNERTMDYKAHNVGALKGSIERLIFI